MMALQDVIAEGVSLRNIELYTGRYEGADLTGIDFTEADLTELTFANLSMKNAQFDRALFQEVTFEKVDLTGTSFRSSILSNVDFTTALGLLEEMFYGAAICPDVRFPIDFDVTKVFRSGEIAWKHDGSNPESYWFRIQRECVDLSLSRESVQLMNQTK